MLTCDQMNQLQDKAARVRNNIFQNEGFYETSRNVAEQIWDCMPQGELRDAIRKAAHNLPEHPVTTPASERTACIAIVANIV